jgi:hypothetical protein
VVTIRSPRCPGCDVPPTLVVGVQAFCENDPDCRVLSWDMRDDPARFKATAKVIDLIDPPGVLPPEVQVRPPGRTCDDPEPGAPAQ